MPPWAEALMGTEKEAEEDCWEVVVVILDAIRKAFEESESGFNNCESDATFQETNRQETGYDKFVKCECVTMLQNIAQYICLSVLLYLFTTYFWNMVDSRVAGNHQTRIREAKVMAGLC